MRGMLSCCSRVRLFSTDWIATCQAPLSMEFSRQEYWSGLACPPSGDLPNPGIEPMSLMSSALAGRFFTIGTTWKARHYPEIALIDFWIFQILYIYLCIHVNACTCLHI